MPASFAYTKLLDIAFQGSLNWTGDTIRLMLLQSTYAPDRDHSFVSDVDANEVSGGSYARITASSPTVTKDDANDQVELDLADVTFFSPTSGQVIIGMLGYKQVGADDSTPGDDPVLFLGAFGGGDVVGVDTTTETFTIEGDETSNFSNGDALHVHGSTGNDGAYTVSSVSLNGQNTDIVVSEDVTDATADGTVYKTLAANGNNIDVTPDVEGVIKALTNA